MMHRFFIGPLTDPVCFPINSFSPAGEGTASVCRPEEFYHCRRKRPDPPDGHDPGVLRGRGAPNLHHEESVWWDHCCHRCGGVGCGYWPAGSGECTILPKCH